MATNIDEGITRDINSWFADYESGPCLERIDAMLCCTYKYIIKSELRKLTLPRVERFDSFINFDLLIKNYENVYTHKQMRLYECHNPPDSELFMIVKKIVGDRRVNKLIVKKNAKKALLVALSTLRHHQKIKDILNHKDILKSITNFHKLYNYSILQFTESMSAKSYEHLKKCTIKIEVKNEKKEKISVGIPELYRPVRNLNRFKLSKNFILNSMDKRRIQMIIVPYLLNTR